MKWLNNAEYRAEMRHSIRVALTMAKLRKKRLFKDVFQKNRLEADRSMDELADEVMKGIPPYAKVQKPEPPRGHSTGGFMRAGKSQQKSD